MDGRECIYFFADWDWGEVRLAGNKEADKDQLCQRLSENRTRKKQIHKRCNSH